MRGLERQEQFQKAIKIYAVAFSVIAVMVGCKATDKNGPASANAPVPSSSTTTPAPSAATSTVKGKIDPCKLLTNDDLKAVQGETPKKAQGSDREQGGFNLAQCYYSLPTNEFRIQRHPGRRNNVRLSKPAIGFLMFTLSVVSVAAQQAAEQRVGLSEAATALDAKGAAAIEARLSTTMLNGSEDSPVSNVRLVVKNVSPTFYTYVTGWATFYDSGAVRCGEGLFKVDALAPNESSETDTPGLRLRCTPATWRVTATNLLTRTADIAKPTELTALPAEPNVVEKPAPRNFVISIDGEEHPIQLDNPIVLKLGNGERKIVLRSAP